MFESTAYILFSGATFAVIHSILASEKSKNIGQKLGLNLQVYRLAYVVFALVTTLVWLVFVYSLADVSLYRLDSTPAWFCRAVQALGLVLFWASLRPIDTRVFLGLRKFPEGIEPFVERGIYCYVRHPMYLAAMLIMFAMPEQSVNSLSLYLVITLYFVIGAKFEERRLLQAHPEYADYQKRVGAFFPNLGKKFLLKP